MEFDLTESLNITDFTLQAMMEVLIVLGIGLIMGLEREYSSIQKGIRQGAVRSELFAGVRTFPLVALMGYLSIFLGDELSLPWLFPLTLIVVAAFSVAAYYLSNLKREDGSTTQFALLAAFLLSGIVYHQEYLLAAFLGLLITALLAFKVGMHKAVTKLSQRDILSILLFAVITALILPLLPNIDLGPYGAFNPFRIWLIATIFISLNFVGYFLHKFIGSKYSIVTTGILGGFISSTATAWYFSRLGGKSKEGGMSYVGAIMLASSIMFPRLLIWLFVLNATLFSKLWLPILVFGLIGFFSGFYFSKKSFGKVQSEEQTIENPINLKDASVFVFLYIVILLLVGFAEETLGNRGVYFAAGISGLTTIDAITISMAGYMNTLGISVASIAILIAAFSNTLIKFVLCLIFGNNNMRKYAAIGFTPIFAALIAYMVYLVMSAT